MAKKILIITLLLGLVQVVLSQPVASFTCNNVSGCSPVLASFTSTSTGSPTSYLWDFGNGNTSTLANPSAAFSIAGKYTVKLTVTDASGANSVTKTDYITVFANPVADFGSNDLGGCNPDTVCFTDLSIPGSGNINKWSWDFGDGNSSALQNPCNTYTFSNNFNVTLVVKDVNGCQNTIIKSNYISITPGQTVDFTSSNTFACNPTLTTIFTDATTPTNPSYSYEWDFGDGGASTQKNPSHNFTTSGYFTVKLKVSSPNGCIKSIIKKNHIYIPNIKANFSLSNTSGCAPLKVSTTNLTSPDSSIVSYDWSTTPTGPTSTQKNPILTFTTPGTYSIKLTSKILGCTNAITKTDVVTVYDKPVASFSPRNQAFCILPATVNFTSSGTDVVSWNWDFGDGTTSTTQNPTKTYSSYGKYTVRLIVTNLNGCKDTLIVQKCVQIGQSGFVMQLVPTEGCKPLKVTFNAFDTSVVPLTTWEWKVNGVPITLTNNTYTFNDTGRYTVTCTGSNSFGCSMTLSDIVKVGIPPQVDFSIDKHDACFSSATFHFNNLTNSHKPKADSFKWTLGNIVINTTKDSGFSYTIKDTGVVNISLIGVYNGCPSVPVYDSVVVHPPKADFKAPLVNCANDTLFFRNGSFGGNKWLWTFGDGDSSTLKEPKHQYLTPGNFTIRLKVTDTIWGCPDFDSDTIHIPVPPQVKFSQSDTVGCPGVKITFEDKSVLGSGLSIVDWTYLFGDGQIAYVPSQGYPTPKVDITFNQSGYFYAQLYIRDNRNCYYYYYKDSAVHIYNIKAQFNVTPDKGCAPILMNVTDSSTGDFPIRTRKWYWGTGDSTFTDSVTKTAAYLYSKLPANQNTGYPLMLVVVDSMGCKASVTKTVKPTRPVPDYTTKTVKRCGYDSILFSSTASGFNPLSFSWDFANGQVSNTANAIQKYSGDTAYSVKLLVKDGNGCYDSIYKTVPIHAKLPVVGFNASPIYIPCPPGVVAFSDTSVMGGDSIAKWQWDLGEGTKSSLKNPSKTYYTPGVFPVSLRITDKTGCTDSVNKSGYIIIGGPIGTFSFTPKFGCLPLAVQLTAISANAKKFEWDLADGSPFDTNAIDTHFYTRASIYIPSVVLTDSNGCKYPLAPQDTIVVYPLPSPDFLIDRTAICKDGAIHITDKTTHPNNIPIQSYLWLFGTGDSSLSPGPNLSYQYNIAGKFDISLIVVDTLGCRDTLTRDSVIAVIDDTIPPKTPIIYRATVEDNTDVLVEFTSNDEIDWAKYSLYYNYNGTVIPQSLLTKTNSIDTTFIESGINTLENVYSYYVTATDVCFNESPPSVKNTTVELKATSVLNAIQLDWTKYYGWDSVRIYEIYRMNPDSGSSFIKIADVDGGTFTYIDTNIYCYKPFYYHIKAIQNSGLFQFSWSDTSGAVPAFQTTVPSTQNVRATVVADSYVLLQWRKRKHKLPFTYIIYRVVDAGNPVFFKELNETDTFLIDRAVDVDEHSYTYITYLKDNCGGLSPASNIAQTILLKADLEKNDILKYDPVVVWSPYQKWSTGVDHYKVEFYFDSTKYFSTLGIKQPNELSLSHKYVNLEQREYCYLVTAYQKDSQSIFSESNIACVSTAPRLYAPNVFTVNGDNINEVFQLGGVFLDTYHISIYDRWGELMFESNDIHQSWDGTYKGKPCQSDVFVYIAEGTGRKGQRISIKGNVTLLR